MTVFLEHETAGFLSGLSLLVPRTKTKVHSILNGLTSYLLLIFIVIGQNSSKQEISDHTKRPHIYFFSIGLLEQNFGGHIGPCAERIQTSLTGSNNLGETKVYNLAISGV